MNVKEMNINGIKVTVSYNRLRTEEELTKPCQQYMKAMLEAKKRCSSNSLQANEHLSEESHG